MRKKSIFIYLIIILISSQVCLDLYCAPKVRFKDVAQIQGVRSNHLYGYGLVIGLNDTGDSSSSDFTVQSVVAMLERMGITVPKNKVTPANVAAVIVTAELPPFMPPGSRIDITVSSIGDCESLYGGTLLITPMQAVDGNIYAVAQGAVSLGGFSFGSGGASAVKNVPTSGVISNGALVERSVPTSVMHNKTISISLREPDFTSAKRMTEAVNAVFIDVATAKDAATVSVVVPPEYILEDRIVEFISLLENLELRPDVAARIVVNERTGTIVAGNRVRISTVAVSHGNLNVVIKSTPIISQPNPLASGTTVVASDDELTVEEENNPLVVMEDGVSIGEVAKALNALGATPRDLIAIFQAMKRAGAIQAELILM